LTERSLFGAASILLGLGALLLLLLRLPLQAGQDGCEQEDAGEGREGEEQPAGEAAGFRSGCFGGHRGCLGSGCFGGHWISIRNGLFVSHWVRTGVGGQARRAGGATRRAGV